VNGTISADALAKLQKGVKISLPSAATGGPSQMRNVGESNNIYTTLPCKVRILETKVVEVTNDVSRMGGKNSTNQNASRQKFKGICNKCGEAGHKN
jgi:hypothetical protein